MKEPLWNSPAAYRPSSPPPPWPSPPAPPRSRQFLVSCGGKQSFFTLVQAVINPGDEVIIPAPYWVSYPDIVILADGKPVIIEAGIEQGFKITPQQLKAALKPKTKLVV